MKIEQSKSIFKLFMVLTITAKFELLKFILAFHKKGHKEIKSRKCNFKFEILKARRKFGMYYFEDWRKI